MSHLYADPAYVAAVAEGGGGRAVPVPAWGAPVMTRPIPEGGEDAAGAYPMAALSPDADLAAGLAQLADEDLVSVVLVGDPLHGPAATDMAAAFDLARPFKTHYLVDPRAYAPSKHHRQEIRRALKRCEVEPLPLAACLAEWKALYGGLIERHAIKGPAAFSDACFDGLAQAQGVIAFAARVEGQVAAVGLWFEHQGVAYNHLGASNAAGYAAGASYGLYDAAIAHFSQCRLINLGGGAGFNDDPADGLAAFKRGFANVETKAWLYGKVLDRARYDALSGSRQTSFFPAYRG
jgi:hypothetical protein